MSIPKSVMDNIHTKVKKMECESGNYKGFRYWDEKENVCKMTEQGCKKYSFYKYTDDEFASQKTVPDDWETNPGYFEWRNGKCITGNDVLRRLCTGSKSDMRKKNGSPIKGFYGTAPFEYDSVNWVCKDTEEYCTKPAPEGKEVSFDSSTGCYVPLGQRILELIFGKVITRNYKAALQYEWDFAKKMADYGIATLEKTGILPPVVGNFIGKNLATIAMLLGPPPAQAFLTFKGGEWVWKNRKKILEDLSDDAKKLANAIENCGDGINQYKKNIDTNIQKLQSNIDSLKKEIENDNNTIKDYNNQIQKLESETNATESQIDQLKQKVQTLQTEESQYKTKISTLNVQIAHSTSEEQKYKATQEAIKNYGCLDPKYPYAAVSTNQNLKGLCYSKQNYANATSGPAYTWCIVANSPASRYQPLTVQLKYGSICKLETFSGENIEGFNFTGCADQIGKDFIEGLKKLDDLVKQYGLNLEHHMGPLLKNSLVQVAKAKKQLENATKILEDSKIAQDTEKRLTDAYNGTKKAAEQSTLAVEHTTKALAHTKEARDAAEAAKRLYESKASQWTQKEATAAADYIAKTKEARAVANAAKAAASAVASAASSALNAATSILHHLHVHLHHFHL